MPYLLAAAYAAKLALTREPRRRRRVQEPERRRQLLVATLAIVYSIYLLDASGRPDTSSGYLLIYAPGTVLYVIALAGSTGPGSPPGRGDRVRCPRLLAVLALVLLARGTFDLL